MSSRFQLTWYQNIEHIKLNDTFQSIFLYHLLVSYKILFSQAILLVSNLTTNEFVQTRISLKHTILYSNVFTFQLKLWLQDLKIKRDGKMKYSLITLSVFSPSLMIGFRKTICHIKWLIRFILWKNQ